jgi:hypothetical protein
MLLAALIESEAATGSSCRRFPSSQTCFARATQFHPYHGGWRASLRLPPCAGRHRSPDRSKLCSTHQIVIKKHRSSLSGNTVHLTYASTALLHHFFTRRAMGDIAPR